MRSNRTREYELDKKKTMKREENALIYADCKYKIGEFVYVLRCLRSREERYCL